MEFVPIAGALWNGWEMTDTHPGILNASSVGKNCLMSLTPKKVIVRLEVRTAIYKVITDTEGFYERVLVPPRGRPILFENPTIIAMDSEFEGGKLLTIQFSMPQRHCFSRHRTLILNGCLSET